MATKKKNVKSKKVSKATPAKKVVEDKETAILKAFLEKDYSSDRFPVTITCSDNSNVLRSNQICIYKFFLSRETII